jgi:hypothetical protein
MLMKALQDQIAGRSQEGTRRGAVLRLAWSRPAKPQVDWRTAYPCTRMHGADFENEFYSGDGAEREG